MEFSISKMKEIIQSETTLRCSEDAAKLLSEILEDHGSKISEEALDIAQEDGRKTVREEDIRSAILGL